MLQLVALALLTQQALHPVAEGEASYYTVVSASSTTASGEAMNDELLTCALRKGEFGDCYLVVADNGKSVLCKLNDRGPYTKGRVIDLSHAAMRQLHPTAGTINVQVFRLKPGRLWPFAGS